APAASFTALLLIPDSRVTQCLADPVTRGVMYLYLQLATVFVALLISVISSISYMTSTSYRPLRRVAILGLLCTGLVFVWFFASGGAARIRIDDYIPNGPFRPGDFEMIPPNTMLTYIRVGLFILGTLFTIFELRRPKI